jgi:hypothetical protein
LYILTEGKSLLKPKSPGKGLLDISEHQNENASGLASIYKRNLEHFGIDFNKEEKVEMRTMDLL